MITAPPPLPHSPLTPPQFDFGGMGPPPPLYPPHLNGNWILEVIMAVHGWPYRSHGRPPLAGLNNNFLLDEFNCSYLSGDVTVSFPIPPCLSLSLSFLLPFFLSRSALMALINWVAGHQMGGGGGGGGGWRRRRWRRGRSNNWPTR